MITEDKILLVEDDESLGYLLSEYLGIKGFSVAWAKKGEEALKTLDSSDYDLAILDVMLPDIDGFTLAKRIGNEHPEIPFLFLTARSLKIDVLKGFSLGAVDYLKKPIDEEELVVRIQAILSRLAKPEKDSGENGNFYKLGKYEFHVSRQELKIDKQVISLTGREAETLHYLLKNKNNLSSHRDILIEIWGKNDYFNRKSLNVFISHLRKYLQQDPRIKIENIHMKGFILKIEED